MGLTKEEQAELDQLKAEVSNPKSSGLSPEEQAELDQLKQEVGSEKEESFLEEALKAVQTAGKVLDYPVAPFRSAIGAGIDLIKGEGKASDILTKPMEPLLQGPGVAPTEGELVRKAFPNIDQPSVDTEPEKKTMAIDIGLKEKPSIPTSEMIGMGLSFLTPGAALKTAGTAGKIAGKLPGINQMAKGLSTLKKSSAIRQTGAMLKDVREMEGAKRTDRIAERMLNQKISVLDEAGNVVGETPLLQAGDNFDDVARKASEFNKQSGKNLGDIYKEAQQKINDAIVSSDDVNLLDKISKNTPTVGQLRSEIVPKITESLKGSGKSGPIKAVEGYLDDILVDYADKPLDLLDLHFIKSKIGEEINWSRNFARGDFPNRDKAFVTLYKEVSDKIDNQMKILDEALESSGNGSLSKALKQANLDFTDSATILKMSKDRASREQANNFLSLTDKIYLGTGAATGAMGSLATGNTSPETIAQNAALGALAGLGSKQIRTRGAGILAKTLAGTETAAGNLANAVKTSGPLLRMAGEKIPFYLSNEVNQPAKETVMDLLPEEIPAYNEKVMKDKKLSVIEKAKLRNMANKEQKGIGLEILPEPAAPSIEPTLDAVSNMLRQNTGR